MNLKEQYEKMKKDRQEAFYGKRFYYNTPAHGTRQIGVTQGLGGDCWIVAYLTPTGARKKIKTTRLPVSADPAKLQELFEAWAQERGLEEAADV